MQPALSSSMRFMMDALRDLGGAGEKDYLLSGNWGALAIILWSLRASTYFWRFREYCQKRRGNKFLGIREDQCIILGIKGTQTPLWGLMIAEQEMAQKTRYYKKDQTKIFQTMTAKTNN